MYCRSISKTSTGVPALKSRDGHGHGTREQSLAIFLEKDTLVSASWPSPLARTVPLQRSRRPAVRTFITLVSLCFRCRLVWPVLRGDLCLLCSASAFPACALVLPFAARLLEVAKEPHVFLHPRATVQGMSYHVKSGSASCHPLSRRAVGQ